MLTVADYERAELQITTRESKRGFALHAGIYAVVMTGLIVLNLLVVTRTTADFVWFPFPLLGWGVGLTMHYLHGVRWHERDIRNRQDKIERHAATR